MADYDMGLISLEIIRMLGKANLSRSYCYVNNKVAPMYEEKFDRYLFKISLHQFDRTEESMPIMDNAERFLNNLFGENIIHITGKESNVLSYYIHSKDLEYVKGILRLKGVWR